jgi:hypothetical protein
LVFYCCLQFFKIIAKPIIEAQNNGGLYLRVGPHKEAKTYRFWPTVVLYVGDNVGSSQSACVKQGGTPRPCRICTTNRTDIHDYNCSHEVRNGGYTHALQTALQKLWTKKLHKIRRSKNEMKIEMLGMLESLTPVASFWLSKLLGTSFKDFESHQAFSPDKLHTDNAGILKNWLFWTLVIIVLVSELDPRYKDNVALLDACIADFCQKHCLDVKSRPFPKGISEYVKTATSGSLSSKEASTSGLGGVDHQYIPSLVLQGRYIPYLSYILLTQIQQFFFALVWTVK